MSPPQENKMQTKNKSDGWDDEWASW
jgi:hypothetical protein